MDITIFLAQLWGPVMIAVGIGVFGSRTYYKQLYRDVGKDALAGILFGMVAMTAGLAHVLFHNAWGTLAEGIVSFLGWGLLAKGVLYTAAPKFVDRAGEAWAKLNFGPIAGVMLLAAGAYLAWFGYFA